MTNIPAASVDKDDAPASFKWATYLMGAVAFVSLVGPHLFFWLWRTAILKDGQPVKDELWSQYGDFIGGIANPVISLLTFAGLLYTILVQRQELALQRRELANSTEALRATKEELRETKEIAARQERFNQIESRKTEIEKALTLVSTELDAVLSFRTADGMRSVRQRLAEDAPTCMDDFFSSEKRQEAMSERTDAAIRLILQLGQFATLYSQCTSQSPLIHYYYAKYCDIVRPIYETDKPRSKELLDLNMPRIVI